MEEQYYSPSTTDSYFEKQPRLTQPTEFVAVSYTHLIPTNWIPQMRFLYTGTHAISSSGTNSGSHRMRKATSPSTIPRLSIISLRGEPGPLFQFQLGSFCRIAMVWRHMNCFCRHPSVSAIFLNPAFCVRNE